MKVYILAHFSWDEYEIIGVFSTPELAYQAEQKLPKTGYTTEVVEYEVEES